MLLAGAGSAGQEGEVTGVHDEAGVQVQALCETEETIQV